MPPKADYWDILEAYFVVFNALSPS